MKKGICLLLIIMIMCLCISVAYAQVNITLSKSKASPGETVMISGVAEKECYVTVKAVDEQNNIVYLDTRKADISGKYTTELVVPKDTTSKKLTVTAGSGNDVASAMLTIVKPTPTPKPTATPSPTASPSPTPLPTSVPSQMPIPTPEPIPTVKPTHTASPTAQKTQIPANSPRPSADPITTKKPSVIQENKKQNTITVEINISDLPQGTKKITLPNGTTIDIHDQSGSIQVEVDKNDLSEDGVLEITLLDESGVPLGAYQVRTDKDAMIENAVSVNTDAEAGLSGVLLWILMAAAVLVGASILIYILVKKKK